MNLSAVFSCPCHMVTISSVYSHQNLHRFFTLSFPFCLLLAGCATLTLERIAVPTGEVWLTPQWRISTGSNARTVEVFVENGTEESVVLSGLALDGVALPTLPPERRKKGAPPMPLWWRITPTGDASGRDAPASRRKAAQMCRPCQKDGGIPQSEISCHMREKRG